MIPQIVFEYSWIYDDHWRKLYPKDYPSATKIFRYLNVIRKDWEKISKKVLIEISVSSRLKWKEKRIKCYVVGKCDPFSEPLTIHVFMKKSLFIDVLIHELIHQIFIQNMDTIDTYFSNMNKKYPKESITTRIHIPLHAIHKNIYLKLFNQERLNRDIAFCKRHPDYRRSWEIVENEGYENIIKNLRWKK